MKIAITSQGSSLDDMLDPRFGRAKQFIIVDLESNETVSVDNTQNLNTAQGAGIQAAQSIVDLGAEAILTGHCGPKAYRVLACAGVAVFCVSAGTCNDALEQYNSGELKAVAEADVDGHW